MNLLSVEKISKSFGEKSIFSEITFGIDKGQKIALVAKNGAGKTTLLNCLIGKDQVDEGRVVFRSDIAFDYMVQEEDFNASSTIQEVIMSGANVKLDLLSKYNQALEKGDQKSIELLSMKITEENAWDYDNRVHQILSVLGLHDMHAKIETLSGGQRKRISLAKVLLSEADILFLDEPTNHLDLNMIEWLENYLSNSNKTLLMVTHDRYFLEVVCDEILELDDATLYKYKGNFSYYLEKKAEREQQLASSIEKAKNTFKKELNWIRRQPKARGTKQKGRIDRFEGIKNIAQQKISEDEMDLHLNITRLGTKIIELHKISKSFGNLKLIAELSYVFQRNRRIGIIGQNGTGKSTFLKMILNQELVDKGKIIVGETVKFGYFSQEQLKFQENQKVLELVKEKAEYIPLEKGKIISAAQLLERFLIPKNMHYWHVSKLSGGEKRRLKLLQVLIENPNFLILDEPTNDLDIFTMSVLEEYLMHFKGCLLVVSHDRYFMDKMVDELFIFRGDGVVDIKTGNYNYFLTEEKNSSEIKSLEKKSSTEKTERSKDKIKLSFKEKIEFETLEKEIAALETEKNLLTKSLSSEQNSKFDYEDLGKKLKSIVEEIDEKTNRWLYLSERES